MFVLALYALPLATIEPAHAEIDYPYCMKVYSRDWYVDCRFSTLAQCQASASGRSAECYLDPFYKGKPGSPYHVGPTYLPSGGYYGPDFYAGSATVTAPRSSSGSKRARRHRHHH
ncbi:MAG TPA: DUF3551 domain-containing protein [Afipia sp.]